MPPNRFHSERLAFYRRQIEDNFLPFWMNRALDPRGGVFTCFNNDGTRLLSRDKYTWSQGRFVWVLSRVVDLARRGLLGVDPKPVLEHARKTVEFLRRNVFLEDGGCAFLLSESGEWKESSPGAGYDVSLFADCFVVIGFSEYARTAEDGETLEGALRLFRHVEKRVREGKLRTEPFPIRRGYRAHSVSMILLNTAQELALALESLGRPEAASIRERVGLHQETIVKDFLQEDGIVLEMLPSPGEKDTLLARHVNPGHALESVWFVMREALKDSDERLLGRLRGVVKRIYEIGWDERHGGILHFVDREGGPPRGRPVEDRYQSKVLETWDTKLWWVHSEALYATLLAATTGGDPALEELYDRTFRYTFETFPHPDSTVGEWIQIRDRAGRPLEAQVALPVKDPYHVLRNFLLIVELTWEGNVG